MNLYYGGAHLNADQRVHVQPGKLPGLYHRDADLIVLHLKVLLKASRGFRPTMRKDQLMLEDVNLCSLPKFPKIYYYNIYKEAIDTFSS